ncbi:MAG: hypothetical protein DI587_03310 [Variovorax paradoxus]|nr:MAG: hypothetical protein DI583_03310 [Variovorax paradoxus]PZQ15727.1 MAG: hypothetical protein DI587_03310 [Variovorax paradoxus]
MKVATGETSFETTTLRVISALQAKVSHFQAQAEGMDPNEARVMTVSELRSAYQIHPKHGAALGCCICDHWSPYEVPPLIRQHGCSPVDKQGSEHRTTYPTCRWTTQRALKILRPFLPMTTS